MKLSSRLAAAFFVGLGLALFAWIAWDASAVVSALRLDGYVSEAAVALAGLATSALAIGCGIAYWRAATHPAEPAS